MVHELSGGQQQALESCLHDAVSFMSLFTAVGQHPQAALLILGMVPLASLFVVESYDCLTTILPELRAVLNRDHAELLRASRHRAKLLDGGQTLQTSVVEAAGELLTIAKEQRQFFLEPHSGLLAPLKRCIQPNIGLYMYNGHIFCTTHTTIFGFGAGVEFEAAAYPFGEALGEYTSSLLELFGLPLSSAIVPADLPGNIEMRDIKYEALYGRAPVPVDRMDLAAGLILLLAHLNNIHHVLCRLLPAGEHTLFRLKFLVAFHADSNIKAIQNNLSDGKSLEGTSGSFFREALGNSDSRWLRKRRTLRNFLTHYLPDMKIASEFPSDITRVGVIECLGGVKPLEEIDALLDRHISHLSRALEVAFQLRENCPNSERVVSDDGL